MASDYIGEFHAERIVDGDASALTALTLYEIGTDTEIDLDERFLLAVTDVLIMEESAGDIALVAGTDAASNRIVAGAVAALAVIDLSFKTPYMCAPDNTLKYKGVAGSTKSSCIVRGFIISR